MQVEALTEKGSSDRPAPCCLSPTSALGAHSRRKDPSLKSLSSPMYCELLLGSFCLSVFSPAGVDPCFAVHNPSSSSPTVVQAGLLSAFACLCAQVSDVVSVDTSYRDEELLQTRPCGLMGRVQHSE